MLTSSTRPLLWLFAVGAAAATLSLVLAPATVDRTQVGAVCVAGWGLAVVLCLVPARLPRWAVHVSLAAGTVLVEWITLASGNAQSPYPALYFLVATCAFCFLSKTEAVLQALFIAVAYAVGLAVGHGGGGSGGLRWIVFVLALGVAGVFIAALRVKHEQLMAEFRVLARTDPQTGLLDRDGFEGAMANEMERVRRSGSRFGLIVVAIDGAEAIGNRFNSVVVTIAETIGRAKRDIDTAARLEENEFAIIATYTDERGADVLAERICSQVRASGLGTVSAGVVCHPRHGADTETLLKAAREARAQALQLGGDRSLVAASAADAIAARLAGADVQVVQVT